MQLKLNKDYILLFLKEKIQILLHKNMRFKRFMNRL